MQSFRTAVFYEMQELIVTGTTMTRRIKQAAAPAQARYYYRWELHSLFRRRTSRLLSSIRSVACVQSVSRVIVLCVIKIFYYSEFTVE